MEGGNKTQLNLEAGLDVNTSDMLVSVNQNTWQHNWQKYQGKFLPNSLRFEKNGWAAGWNVYDFKYENVRSRIDTDSSGNELDFPYFASNVQLNEVPTYMVSLYDAEYSADILRSFAYNKDSKVLYLSTGEAVFDLEHDNELDCAFSDVSCTVSFDKITHELTLDDDSAVSLNYEKQKDNNSYKIELVRKQDKVDVDLDFKTGLFLDCEQFIHTINYKGFSSGSHKWNDNDSDTSNGTRGSQYVFDGSQLTVDGTSVPYTALSSTDNELVFNYTQPATKGISLALMMNDYIDSYSDFKLVSSAYDSEALTTVPGSNVVAFNKFAMGFSNSSLSAGNNISCDLKVPLWLTVSYKIAVDTSVGAWEPDNTYLGAIRFGGAVTVNSNTEFRAINVFEPDTVTVGKVADFSANNNSKLHYRYNQIALGNSISWKYGGGSTTKLRIVPTTSEDWIGYLGNFPSINLDFMGSGTYSASYYGIKARVKYWFGENVGYSIGSFKVAGDDYYKKNDCFDDSVCSSVENVHLVKSVIRRKRYPSVDGPWLGPSFQTDPLITEGAHHRYTLPGSVGGVAFDTPEDRTQDIADELQVMTDDFNALVSLEPDLAVNPLDSCPGTLYSANQAATNVYSIYRTGGFVQVSSLTNYNMCGRSNNSNGNNGYTVGTYEQVATNLDVFSEDYWPFNYVPKFNVRDAQANIITGVYAVLLLEDPPGSNSYHFEYITSLSEFKKMIRGVNTTNYSLAASVPFVSNSSYTSRKRTVIRFRDPFFDYERFNSDMSRNLRLQWETNWKLWYPGVRDPQSLSSVIDMEESNLYINFDNIEIKDCKVMTKNDYDAERQEYENALLTPNDAASSIIISNYRAEDRPRVYIDFATPGCVVDKWTTLGMGNIVSLNCFNSLGLIPWKNAATRGDTITFLPSGAYELKVYHNHKDETSLYSVSGPGNGTATLSFSNRSWTFPSAKAYNQSGDIGRRTDNFSTTSIAPDSLNLNAIIGYTGTVVGYTMSGGGCNFTVTKTSDNAWLNSLVIRDEAIDSIVYNKDITSDLLNPAQYVYDPIDGVEVACCFYGHIGLKIAYNTITAARDLSSYTKVDDDNITFGGTTPVMEIRSLTDNELLSNKVYIDRNTVSGSYKWLKAYIDELNPFIHKFLLNGADVVSNDPNNPVKLRFGEFHVSFIREPEVIDEVNKSFVIFYGQTDVDSNNLPILYRSYYPNINGNINGHVEGDYETIGGLGVSIVGTANSTRVPVGAEFIVYNDSDINHKFFTEGLLAFRNTTFQGITQYADISGNSINIPVFLTHGDTADFTMTYNTVNGKLSIPDFSNIQVANAGVSVSSLSAIDYNILSTDQDDNRIIRNFNVSLVLSYDNVHGKFVRLLTENYTLVNYDNNVFTINYNDGTDNITFDYDLTLNRLLDRDSIIKLSFNEDVYNINFLYGQTQVIIAIFNHITDNNELAISYHGKDMLVDMSPFTSTANDIMSVEFTDIRLSDKSKYLGDINASTEKQIVRQQWDSTVNVENFWWVNPEHILELNTHYFVYKRNTHELDDWNGNKWEKIFEIPKLNIIGTEPCYYTVLNSYDNSDGLSYFMLIKVVDTRLRVMFYDIGNEFNLLGYVELMMMHKDLGDILNSASHSGNTAYLNTYSHIACKQILTQAKWSNTIRDDRIFLGCHVSNNFDQWAIIIDPNKDGNGNITGFRVSRCIQGYGFVGLTGDLTGGQIPAVVFDVNSGFNSAVYPIEDLTKIPDNLLNRNELLTDIDSFYLMNNGDEAHVNEIEKPHKVYGTAEKQWYIFKEVKNIVSHLTYDVNSHDFVVQYLPITNTYEAIYKSPSFKSELLYDNKIGSKALSRLFDTTGTAASVWGAFVQAALNPDIYLYAPKIASIIYLQQTFGQYAYVHYNSSIKPEKTEVEDKSEDLAKAFGNNGKSPMEAEAQSPLLSDDITFDKQIFKQVESMPWTPHRQGILFLFNIFLPAIKAVDKKLSVNEGINWTTINEAGSVFTQSVSENLLNVMTKSLHSDSPTAGISSTVVGIRSLDMFYSTCENQRVFAGPGFVEHQFVAECTAQSVTDVQVTSYVEQLSFVIKILSTWKLKLAYMATKFVHDLTEKTADYTASTTIEAVGSGGNAAGVAVAIAMIAALQVTKLAARAIMIAQEEVDALISTMADKMKADAIDTNINGKTETEGKHKYGEKNEYFMWPCWGVPSEGLDYTDETVVACTKKTEWAIDLMASRMYNDDQSTSFLVDPDMYKVPYSSMDVTDAVSISRLLQGGMPLYVASCYGKSSIRKLPKDMAKIEGVPNFLPVQAFKNQNISVSEPSFTPSLFQDYIIDHKWELSQCVTYGLTQWVSCKDTKIINCAPSNMVITDDFCGVACPYTAVEIKRGLSKAYMRPWAVTPNILAFNSTGYNTALDNKLYHAFDGISYRIVDWTGSPGMNKNNQTFLYCFQLNDRFKRSNKFPANEVQGNFDSEPAIEIHTIDNVYTLVTNAAKQKGMEGGTIGEDKDATRWAIPIFTELINTMPAAVKTLTAMQLNVFDGITALTTNIMNNQVAYKAPASVDFTIGKNTYRYTNDYICLVQTKEGIDVITEITPVLGLTFIGASLTEAYFYSQATRFFYIFAGNTLMKMDMLERFRDIKTGAWDFINHEVVMPCLMTYTRLDPTVKDSDTETDNIIVPVMSKDKVSGELPPPLTTIFNDRSWYKTISLPAGLAYQGPNRVIINRNVFAEYMLRSMKDNLGKWEKLDREHYDTKRDYYDEYDRININVNGVEGWTYNPFILVTSPLGLNESTDCLFEWTITFCWPVEMDLLYGVDNYAVVNIMSETMTPGGKVRARPTHVFLTKELFTRNGNYGYYSFTYQSKNGAGNRERLHIWSDQYIAISSIVCESKVVTSKRAEILTQQVDVKDLKEL